MVNKPFLKTFFEFRQLSFDLSINTIQDGGGGGLGGGGGGGEGAKSFSPVNSTNVKISYQNFLSFSFNPFITLV